MLIAASVLAQPILAQERVTVGLGLSVNPAALVSDNTSALQPAGVATWYVPMRVGDHIRIEPEIGYSLYHDRQQYNASWDTETRRHYIKVGAGVMYSWFPSQADSAFRGYAGARIGIISAFRELNFFERATKTPVPNSGDGDSRGIVYYGPCLGAEYGVSKHFSIGLEAHLGWYEFGEVVYRYGVPPITYPRPPHYTVLATTGLVFVRVYF